MTLTEAIARLHKTGKIESPWRAGMVITLVRKAHAGPGAGSTVRLLVDERPNVWTIHDLARTGFNSVGIAQQHTFGEPDLTDAPTRGALLDIVREAWGDPAAYASTESTESEGADWGIFTSGDAIIVHRASTEGDAIAAAIIAAAEALEAP